MVNARAAMLIFVFLMAQNCGAIWPPSAEPSPLNFKLANSRYVPSSRRYNLVWGDQLIPSNLPSPTHVTFAANNYAGTQKIYKSQADQFRAVNPNFLVVAYHLAVGLNPEHSTDCPSHDDSNYIGVVSPAGYVQEVPTHYDPWCTAQGVAGQQKENMFQHWDGTADTAHRVWNQDPYWLMNSSNADWQKYMADMMQEWMAGLDDEGVFFDVAVEYCCWGRYHPTSGDSVGYEWWQTPHYPTGWSPLADVSSFATWQNGQYRALYSYVHSRFHNSTHDRLVIPNSDRMVTGWYDPVWLDGDGQGHETIDGAMMEGFGNEHTTDMFLTLSRGLAHLTGRGKILIAQFGADTNAERLRRVGMYMLIKNENSFLNILNNGAAEWYPEYEIDLGDQNAVPSSISSLSVGGSNSLFRRNYAHGFVVCNTDTSAASFTLPAGSWGQVSTTGGGVVDNSGNPPAYTLTYPAYSGSSISVPATGCIIMRDLSWNPSPDSSQGTPSSTLPSSAASALPPPSSALYSSAGSPVASSLPPQSSAISVFTPSSNSNPPQSAESQGGHGNAAALLPLALLSAVSLLVAMQ